MRYLKFPVSLFLLLSINSTAQNSDSLDIKIGQMIMVGFNGTEVNETSQVIKDIKGSAIGGIILYEKNINAAAPAVDLKRLISTLQEASRTPLFISIDEEGGKVNRLKPKYGFPETVTASYLGRINNLDTTYHYGKVIASNLRSLGINVNFAPVLDLCSNLNNPIIAKKDRCFSASQRRVTRHAAEFIRAHREQGVITVSKHFPGHGSSTSDTHKDMTDVTKTWRTKELFPYRSLIRTGNIDAVMTAHIINAKLDTTRLPGTLSNRIMTGWLRNRLNFNGVIFSDDMHMAAIAKYYGFENAIKLAVLAGVDVLLFSNNMEGNATADKIHAIIKEAVLKGEISEKIIDESFKRIMGLKKVNI